MNRAKRAKLVFSKLSAIYPDAHCELNYKTPFQLLVATILSAQCTDARVNIVTNELFKKYPTPQKLGQLSQSELEELVRSTGFFRNKAQNILGATQKILAEFGGEVPQTIEELTSLPGVGRKTANVVLGNAFGIPGLPVDTHVTRLANRLGLTTEQDAVKIESELCKLLPSDDWTNFSHLLIFHGRRVCGARKPQCGGCVIRGECGFGMR